MKKSLLIVSIIFFLPFGFFAQSENHETTQVGENHFRKFAAGIFTEAIFAHHTEWLFGTFLSYEITEHLWIRSGPGIEILQEEIGHTGETESKTEFLYRVGAGYSFHFGRISIDPSIDLDFVRSSTTLAWGVNFGMGF